MKPAPHSLDALLADDHIASGKFAPAKRMRVASNTAAARKQAARYRRLYVEQLEDRTLLAASIFDQDDTLSNAVAVIPSPISEVAIEFPATEGSPTQSGDDCLENTLVASNSNSVMTLNGDAPLSEGSTSDDLPSGSQLCLLVAQGDRLEAGNVTGIDGSQLFPSMADNVAPSSGGLSAPNSVDNIYANWNESWLELATLQINYYYGNGEGNNYRNSVDLFNLLAAASNSAMNHTAHSVNNSAPLASSAGSSSTLPPPLGTTVVANNFGSSNLLVVPLTPLSTSLLSRSEPSLATSSPSRFEIAGNTGSSLILDVSPTIQDLAQSSRRVRVELARPTDRSLTRAARFELNSATDTELQNETDNLTVISTQLLKPSKFRKQLRIFDVSQRDTLAQLRPTKGAEVRELAPRDAGRTENPEQ